MANEVTCNATLQYTDDQGVSDSLQLADFVTSVTTKIVARGSQSIAITDTALNLGAVAALGYLLIINRDPTNYCELKTASSGTIIARLEPGGFCYFKVGSGVTLPALIANTAAVVIDYFLLSL